MPISMPSMKGMARMAKCKGCGAEIIWIKTQTGKKMPCNPDMVMYWEKKNGKGKIITPNGEVLSCVFEGETEKATGYGYTTHWNTCPEAKRFRKKKEEDATQVKLF